MFVHDVVHGDLPVAVVAGGVGVFDLSTPGRPPADADGPIARLPLFRGPPAPLITIPLRWPILPASASKLLAIW